MEVSQTKFCVNCQHFNPNKTECNRPIGISLVTGTDQYKKLSAGIERTLDLTGCGKSARYFELKVEA